ncbi:hypothetical protein ACO2Q7_14725 [Rathayibacter sp. KR2-224]|uniref:hypothetical protein n=1 Tax=Rathayibacter sp. KR2-224 TaxID=3400913 RepID=UPI003C064984
MMAQVLSWAVTVLVVGVAVSFVVSLFSIARLPDERPKVRTFDGMGREIGAYENPGEQIAPGRSGDPIRRRQDGDDTGSDASRADDERPPGKE